MPGSIQRITPSLPDAAFRLATASRDGYEWIVSDLPDKHSDLFPVSSTAPHEPEQAVAMLTMERSDILKSLKPLSKISVTRKDDEAVLSFDGNSLIIESGGFGVGIPAKGFWAGQARVPGKFVVSLVRILPMGNMVVFKIVDGWLRVGTISVGCTWQDAGTQGIDLPVNAELSDFLRIADHYSEEQIAAAGLTKLVNRAIAAREEKIQQAAKLLCKFGVTDAELREIVLRKNAHHARNDPSHQRGQVE